MKPYVVHVERGRLDRRQVHMLALGYAEKTFAMNGHVIPSWVVASPASVAVIETAWQGEAEQLWSVAAMSAVVQEADAQAYALVCEVTEANTADEELIDLVASVGIDAVPADVLPRDKFLTVTSYDAGETVLSQFLISRQHAGLRPILGPRIDVGRIELGGITGMLANFLKPGRLH